MSEKNRKPIAALVLGILILIAATAFALLVMEHADESWRPYALWSLAAVMLAWLIYESLTIYRIARARRSSRGSRTRDDRSQVSMLVLMNEHGTGIQFWDLRDKTGLVIGRSHEGADVDIDLSETEYFSLISNYHAVLNFTEKGWYLADAGSKNGTSLLKAGSKQKLLLAQGEPVPIQPGDTIYIAEETQLAVK